MFGGGAVFGRLVSLLESYHGIATDSETLMQLPAEVTLDGPVVTEIVRRRQE